MKKITISTIIFLVLNTSSFAKLPSLHTYHSIENISAISLDTAVQSHLKMVLTQDYANFYKNFEEYAAPYQLKTVNALYYEGRTKNSMAYSAATIYADGRIFAAIFDKDTNILKYFTNDASCSTVLHPTIQIFIQQFYNPKIFYVNSNNYSVLNFNLNKATDCKL